MTTIEYRPLGRTDMKVSSLCLGTMMYGDQMPKADAFRQMDRCAERGINFFDTAEMYTIPPNPKTQGDSERIVGEWMKERGTRDKTILATKVAGRSTMTYLRDGNPVEVTPAQIRHAVEASLSRLQTDYIDLYQIHWPDRPAPMFGSDLRGFQASGDAETTPIDAQLETLGQLVDEGKVRAVGLSNETPWGVMRFLEAAGRHQLPRVASIQNAYSLINRQFEYGLAEVAMEEAVGLLAYSPLGQGVLSGKYIGGAVPEASRLKLFGRFGRYETPNAEAAVEAYVGLARNNGLDPSAMALQFVTTRPWVTSNIFGASNDDQLDTVFASLDVAWTDELATAVDDIHVRYPNPCP